MKLFLSCALLAVVAAQSSQSIYLQIDMKAVEQQVPQGTLDTLASTLPGLLEANVPPAYQSYAADYKQYVQRIGITQKYDATTKVLVLKAFFPLVPSSAFTNIQNILNAYKDDATVTSTLSAILPTFLGCGSCTYDSIGSGVDSVAPPPTSNPAGAYIIGFKVLIGDATTKVSDALLTTAKDILPPKLKEQLNYVTDLSATEKSALLTFLTKVEFRQMLTTSGLWLGATFPAIPSSYIELYKPLFMKYVYNNQKFREYLQQYVPPLVGCASCKITQYQLINEPPAAPTSKPTANPTAAPTASPTPKPTLAPTLAPTADRDASGAATLSAVSAVVFALPMLF